MNTFFRRQIDEVARDPSLRIYGAILALTHALSAANWLTGGFFRWLAQDVEAICWPFFRECEVVRVLDTKGVAIVILVYGAASFAVAWLFLKPTRETDADTASVAAGYAALIGLSAVKLLFLVADFRLRQNQHYMAGFVTFAFLFLSEKRNAIRLLIPFFYFWAGLLKLTPDWLSGSTLYQPLWFFHDSPLLPWACGYVVVLELGLVWGLWSRRPSVFWAVLAQLFVFHAISYSVVSYFYPLLMIGLLAIFPLCRRFEDRPRRKWPKGEVGAYVLIAFLSVLQLHHHLLPGDTAITGEGRHFSLHMFDAWVGCVAEARIKKKAASFKLDLSMPLPVRLQCDPVVFWNRARHLCRQWRRDAEFVDLDVALFSRRSSEKNVHTVIQMTDFCKTDPDYSMVFSNSWIHQDPKDPVK